jgi:hypothetical protein
MGNKSNLHFWSLGLALIYCSAGAILSLNYWTDLNREAIPSLNTLFLPSSLITADSIYGSGSLTFGLIWHVILLLIAWAVFYLAFKMIRILWQMR